jgi:hypothetical protein
MRSDDPCHRRLQESTDQEERSTAMTTRYEFRVDGRLTEQAREAFCDMRIEDVPAGATIYGSVIDESHLLGIMAQCRVLGLRIVSAHRVDSGTS